MKITFYVSRYTDKKMPTPPSVQYLSGYLLGKGIVNEQDILFTDNYEEILKFKPDILAIGSVSQTFNDAIKTTELIKKEIPDLFCIIGGYHISGLPEQLDKIFDLGILGEGEVTLAEIVELKKIHTVLNEDILKNIKGICYRDENNKIIITDSREQIKDIDTLPDPLKKFFSYEKAAFIFPSRGCPYKCKYCASHKFWGGYRYHSAEYIARQIEYIYKNTDIREIAFADDLFIVPKSRLYELKEILRQKELLGKIEFRCFIRINIFDEETCILLKELGFKRIRFGMESASERILNMYKHQPFNIAQVENVIDMAIRNDMPVSASFMFGFPGETEEDIYATRDFLRKHRNRLKVEGFYLIQPVPGSVLWDELISEGLISETMDFSKLSIDLIKKDFDYENALYLNEKNVPLNRFKEIIEEIKKERKQAKTVLGCGNGKKH